MGVGENREREEWELTVGGKFEAVDRWIFISDYKMTWPIARVSSRAVPVLPRESGHEAGDSKYMFLCTNTVFFGFANFPSRVTQCLPGGS